MAKSEHVGILKRGIEAWNAWRLRNKNVLPDLSQVEIDIKYLRGINLEGADLHGANLQEAILSEANLRGANLQQANLHNAIFENADLREANLSEVDLSHGTFLDKVRLTKANFTNANLSNALLDNAYFHEANLYRANLSHASLSYADLTHANLEEANLEEADLSNARLTWARCIRANFRRARLAGAQLAWTNLSGANLVDATLITASLIETNLESADLSRCWIYGISAWNLNLKGATQRDLIITSNHADKAVITVDNLEIAQFVYLLIRSEKIRDVIDTISTKAVLILGRFTPDRITILDSLRQELRTRNYIPILFNFEKPSNRDLTETVVTLAHLSRFVIVDLTHPSSVPHELQSFVPNLPSVPVQPIILKGEHSYALFEHYRHFKSVLPICEYETQAHLIDELLEKLIQQAEEKAQEMRPNSSL